jgi:hypothetical protein
MADFDHLPTGDLPAAMDIKISIEIRLVADLKI